MANRSYLYTLDKLPLGYDDRPNVIKGLSEFNYDIPAIFYLFVSANTKMQPSLLFDSDQFSVKTFYGDFEAGRKRVNHLIDCLLASPHIAVKTELATAKVAMDRHLDAAALPFAYLETIELDCMSQGDEAGLARLAQAHLIAIQNLATWVDTLTPETAHKGLDVGGLIEGAIAPEGGLDFTRNGPCVRPLGVNDWSDVLYFAPHNAAQWQEN